MIIDCNHPVPPTPALQWDGPDGTRIFCFLCAQVRLLRPEPTLEDDPVYAAARDLYALAHYLGPDDIDPALDGGDYPEISRLAERLRSHLETLRP